jgi:hypothetical protein
MQEARQEARQEASNAAVKLVAGANRPLDAWTAR